MSETEPSERHVQHETDIRDLRAREVFQHGDEVQKLIVVRVAEPAANRDSVLGVENVARGRIVDDDGLAEVSADLAEVFDIVALVVVAAFAEQPVVDDVVDVELIENRVAVFGDGGCEDHDLVQLADSFHEGVDARSFDDVDVMVLAFNLDWYREVCLVEDLDGGQYIAKMCNTHASLP